MTSKKALYLIKGIFVGYIIDLNTYFDLIEKDLQVLEIIKKYAYEINFSIENEDTKKVEDWLYDDK